MSFYTLSDEAIQDLNQLSDYFLRTNVEAGEQLIQAFSAKCQQLTRFPKMGRSHAQIQPELRGLSLRGFIILYRTSGELETLKIEILRVVSGRRDLNAIFSPD